MNEIYEKEMRKSICILHIIFAFQPFMAQWKVSLEMLLFACFKYFEILWPFHLAESSMVLGA